MPAVLDAPTTPSSAHQQAPRRHSTSQPPRQVQGRKSGPNGRGQAARLELADVLHLIYGRDERLLALLDEHLVLSTQQIDQAEFGALRSCQRRLAYLKGLELVDAFRTPRPRRGGSGQQFWTLGRVGLDLHAAARGDSMTTPKAAKEWVGRLGRRPSLSHLLGVNGLFCSLLAAARRQPDAQLTRWWSERTAARRFPWIHPDGHGIWRQDGRAVGLFVEYDTGTENLARLVDKIGGYEQLAGTKDGEPHGPRYPVLFSLHSREREANLHKALAAHTARVPVATTVRPTPDPSGPVWAVVGRGTGHRVALIDLPTDHGPNTPTNPAYLDGVLAPDITGRSTDAAD